MLSHNAALNAVFEEAMARNFLTDLNLPKLEATCKKSERRPSFTHWPLYGDDLVKLITGYEPFAGISVWPVSGSTVQCVSVHAGALALADISSAINRRSHWEPGSL
jgi:hypothetical protein